MTDFYRRLGQVSVLACPRCDSENLHHMNVAINVREGESGVKLLIEGSTAMTQPLTVDAPEFAGGRQWSFVLGMACETCGLQLARRVILHHGQTLEDWVL